LIDGMYPSWKFAITNNRKALSSQPLLISEHGITPMTYTPQLLLTGPASRPTASPLLNRIRPTEPTCAREAHRQAIHRAVIRPRIRLDTSVHFTFACPCIWPAVFSPALQRRKL